MSAIIYTSKTCSPCRMVKMFLSRKGISYIEKDIDDPKNQEDAIKISGQTIVPVVVMNGEVITGYNPQRLSQLLA